MLPRYRSEIEGMQDFWNELGLDPDYQLNTDGVFGGNLIEIKLVFTNIKKHKEQVRNYIKAYNSAALPIPKFSYLIAINSKKYIKIDNENGNEIVSKDYSDVVSEFKDDFINQNDYIKGWIDEYSIVSYNAKLCTDNSKIFKTKENVKNEFIKPKYLNIRPFEWDQQLKLENSNPNEIGWLHFNMNMLGPSLLKKQLGAFFTPDQYVKISTQMVREAITRVPKGNDYIILDRCAGTGNLERFLTSDELSHCVLNTYDYTEWSTLKGLYDGRVRMIIPPTNKSMDFSNGLLKNGDALSEDFYNFCFGINTHLLTDTNERQMSKNLSSWLKDEKMTIIMLENPPFVEPQGGANKGKSTFTIKDKWLYEVMSKYNFKEKNVNRASENLFIWSAFKFYLKQPTDSYILYSPIKYWKSQQIIDKEFVNGYICNRANFNASEGGITLIQWKNIDQTNDFLNFNSDLGPRVIKKINLNPRKLLVDSNGDKLIALMVNLSNMPKLENGKLTNVISSSYAKVQKAYKINSSNALTQIPLWVANCYEAEDYTEKEVIMKSADGGNKYSKDSDFVNDCFVWAGLTNKNKCISDQSIKNQYCFKQSTYADDFLKTLKLSDEAKALLIDWESLLNYAKTTDEYISLNNYGLHQIERELNIKIGTGTFTKTGVEIKAPKYRKLDENISSFKDKLKEFYLTKLKKKLFKYELLK